MDEDVKVKSLKKALDILECFSHEQPELGITQISQMLQLGKSNVHNIVSTFEACGYLMQDEQTGKYRLGLKIMQLSHLISTSMSFQSLIHQCILDLVKEIDEIIYFGVIDGNNIMYMDAGFPDKAFQVRWVQGMTAPLVCTSIGKAILAYQKESFIDEVLSEPLVKYTEHTITDKERLKEQLKLIRERGYSLDAMEHEYGVMCVGVPIFDHRQNLIGAVSATGPSLRFSEDKINQCIRLLKQKTKELQNSI